ncbi:MAG: DnaJ C-terminal domain-containing protein [Pseudomonadota bacterium]
MTPRRARQRLGVGPDADEHALRAAFREAAKHCHPDRAGGDGAAFREVVEAYRLLRGAAAGPPPAPAPVVAPTVLAEPAVVALSPLTAIEGGEVAAETPDGRRLSVRLPAGLRPGERVRAGGLDFEVVIRGEGVLVRGDDLWVTAVIEPCVLADGGRVFVPTPRGDRAVWISRKAAERGLVRLPGEGLPARGDRRQGDLFVRLTAGEARGESPARSLLRRFTAAWAA